MFPAAVLAALLLSACKREADTRSLVEAGMNVSAIRALHDLNVTEAEVAEVLKAWQGGLSDQGCIALVRVHRERGQPFTEGDNVASLVRAGLRESTVLELARLDQMGLWTGEYQLLRLGGFSETMILTLARRRAGGQPTVSGGSLARLKNTGMREGALLELARRGISDSDAEAIFALRRRGTSEAEILRRYPQRSP
jgi:hypothetical protein